MRTLSFPTAPPHPRKPLLDFRYPRLPEFLQKATAAVPRAEFVVPSTHSHPLMAGLGSVLGASRAWESWGQGSPSLPRSSAGSLQLQGPTSQPGDSHATFRLCSGHCSAHQGCAAVKILMSGMWQTFTTCPDVRAAEPALLADTSPGIVC